MTTLVPTRVAMRPTVPVVMMVAPMVVAVAQLLLWSARHGHGLQGPVW